MGIREVITKQREKRFPISYLALKLRYMNKTDTESVVEKSSFQFSLLLIFSLLHWAGRLIATDMRGHKGLAL